MTTARFARLNGWPVLVDDGGASKDILQFGRIERGYLGQPRSERRGLPATWTLRTRHRAFSTAQTLAALVAGRGHHMGFDGSPWSDDGIGPELGGSYAVRERVRGLAGSGVHGTGWLEVDETIVYDVRLPRRTWTVLFWRDVDPRSSAQHVMVRSDGARWLDGVRDDNASTPELVVDEGGVGLLAGDYDDLVVLPFAADEGFLEAFARYTSAAALSFAARFDGDGIDDVHALAPTALTGGFVRGRLGSALNASTSGDGATYPVSAATQVFGRTAFCVSCIVRVDADAVDPSRVIASHVDGGDGWEISLVPLPGSSDHFAVRAFLSTSGVSGEAETIGGVVRAGFDTLVAASWNAAQGAWTVRVGGVVASATSLSSAPGEAASDDSAALLRVGTDGTEAFGGTISDLRIHGLELDESEHAELWQRFLARVPGPLAAPFSRLPELDLTGAGVDFRARRVLGSLPSQPYVQHGGALTGVWTNNAQKTAGELDEVKSVESVRLPATYASWAFDDRRARDPLSGGILCLDGGMPSASPVSTPSFAPGPFGSARSAVMTACGFTLPPVVVEAMAGRSVMGCLAWVRRAADDAVHPIVLASFPTDDELKFGLWFAADNTLRISAKAADADTEQTFASSQTFAAGAWHLVGGFVDLESGQFALFADDAGTNAELGFYAIETGVPFSAPAFSFEGSAMTIGVGIDGASDNFEGEIAIVQLFDARLSVSDVAAAFNLGRRRGLVR
jgi:hypothetical protein